MWFAVAVLAYLLLACVLVMDKIIVSDAKLPPAVYALYSTLPAGLFFLAYPFVGALRTHHMIVAVFSGLAFGVALLCLFQALSRGRASHIGPFGGAMIAVMVTLLSAYFLGERLSLGESAGVALLVTASIMLSFQKTHASAWQSGFAWAMLSSVCFAASHVSAKYLYAFYPFPTVLVWTKGTIGIIGLIILFFPGVRAFLRRQWTHAKKPFRGKRQLLLIIVDKILGFFGEMCVQYAILLGSVTLVNAMAGLQYVILFFLIALLTRFAPRAFREYATRREYIIQAIAVLLIATGSFLFAL